MPGQFNSLDNSTFCSIDKGYSVTVMDNKGNISTRPKQSVCLSLTKVEALWKVRIEWWSKLMNRRHVEYAIVGWVNP